MQTIEVSNATYQKIMSYCRETGQSASVALNRAPAALRDLDKVELLERRSKGKFVSIEEI